MSDVPITRDVAERIMRADIDGMIVRQTSMQRAPGNPYGIALRRFGPISALMARDVDAPFFNRVLGLGPDDAGRLDEVLGWYAEQGQRCICDLVSGYTSPALLRALAERGYYQSGCTSALYGVPSADQPPPPPGMTVRPIAADELDLFADIFVRSGTFDPATWPFFTLFARATYDEPGWRCYLALLDGVPAAVGALYLRDGVATLATGATLPPYRRHGCQQALLHRRIADAAAECDLMIGTTTAGSVSQHNLERAGLRIAYVKSLWSLLA